MQLATEVRTFIAWGGQSQMVKAYSGSIWEPSSGNHKPREQFLTLQNMTNVLVGLLP